MSTLGDVRKELADTLAPLDVTTYTHLPGRADIPSAIVLAGSPYVEQGLTFGERFVRLEVWLSAAKGDNESESSHLDELLDAAIEALESDGWIVEQVSQPFEFQINNGSAYTASITVTASVTF